MTFFHRIESWHQTKTGLLVFGLAGLALAYVFALWALDGGSMLDYLCTLVLLVGGVQNLIKFTLKVVRHA